MNVHAIILAAGEGKRMKSARPKVLHAVGGVPMLGRVLAASRAAGIKKSHIVLGVGADAVRAWLENASGADDVDVAVQKQQLGTAHAVAQALPLVPDNALALVLCGDVPLIRAETLRALAAAAREGLALVTTELETPTGYGRILRGKDGGVIGIVEEKDASPSQRAIREVNTGLLAAPARRLKRWIKHVDNHNAQGEYYLTDVVGLAAADGIAIKTVAAAPEEVEGVNDRAQLARLERRFQCAQAEALMREGLGLADPGRFDLRGTLSFGRDVFIDVGCVLAGAIELGDGVHIGPYCVLRDVRLGAGTRVEAHSVLEQAVAGRACRIGPFARLRPAAALADEVHVGNFVEVKNVRLGQGSKANHLAYLGDGEVGAGVNIGAGTIFCNYDGANKHFTVIEDEAFIGSDTQLVAPVRVGRGATVGAGSTIAKDVPPGGLTLCRAREQKTYPHWKRPRKKS